MDGKRVEVEGVGGRGGDGRVVGEEGRGYWGRGVVGLRLAFLVTPGIMCISCFSFLFSFAFSSLV